MGRTDAAGKSLEFRGFAGYWCEWCHFSNPKREYFQVDHIIPAARREELGIRIEELTDIANAAERKGRFRRAG